MTDEASPPFEQLDFLYTPSRDVSADMTYFTEVLGGRVIFAIEGMGTRVAAIELTEGPPLVLLTDHVEGDRAIFVYRVPDLDAVLEAMASRGWEREHTFEIPQAGLLVPDAGRPPDRPVRADPARCGRALREPS